MATPLLLLLAWATAAMGTLGGLGGAVILVPVLVLAGVDAVDAAPLGLLTVAAGSLAAGPRHLAERAVNHRLGVTTEIAATTGAVAGALVSGLVSEAFLVRALGVVALAAAVAGGWRKGVRNVPHPDYGPEHVGEQHGSLAGAYQLGGGIVPYQARRLPIGLTAMAVSGVIAGISGTSGGFVKTPATSEIMHVPVKVAAATTTFTIGVTASSALLVYTAQGRIDLRPAAAVVLGGLLGGRTGAGLQSALAPPVVRRTLSLVLVAVGAILLATA